MSIKSMSVTRVLAKYIGEHHAVRLLGFHHQQRFETMNVYKRPRYFYRDDGSKYLRGTNICILPNGDIINSDRQPVFAEDEERDEFLYDDDMNQEEEEVEIESSTSTDIRNIHGIGPKS